MEAHMNNITKALILVAALISLSACDKEKQTNLYLDSELSSYVEYYKDFKQINYGTRELDKKIVSIHFESKGAYSLSGKVGMCKIYSKTEFGVKTVTKKVIIDRDYWDRQNEYLATNGESYVESKKLQILFHELGHCDLGRDHNDEKISGTFYPKSLMASVMNMNVNSVAMIQEYQKELFNPGYEVKMSALASKMTYASEMYVASIASVATQSECVVVEEN
jgi:hypothetical protein